MYHDNAMPQPATPAETLAVSTDCTALALDLMRVMRLGTTHTTAQLRAAAALALSLGEPLAHFLEDDAE